MFVPPRFGHASFQSYEVQPATKRLFDAARLYAQRFDERTSSGLLLSGTVGVGKTHLGYAIGRALAEKGFWPYWKSFADVCAAVKATWGDNERSEEPIKEPLLTRSPLILDDLGAEMRDKQAQGWTAEFVFEIVQARYEAQLPTVITSNLNLSDIGKRYTERVASRLAEMCQCVWVQADDYRVARR